MPKKKILNVLKSNYISFGKYWKRYVRIFESGDKYGVVYYVEVTDVGKVYGVIETFCKTYEDALKKYNNYLGKGYKNAKKKNNLGTK
jgi:hypothetical protein